AARLSRPSTPHETSLFQPNDHARSVRGGTRQRAGEPAQRQRSPWLEEVEDMALDRGEIESGTRRRQVRALREEELHEELPGSTGIQICRIHPRALYLMK